MNANQKLDFSKQILLPWSATEENIVFPDEDLTQRVAKQITLTETFSTGVANEEILLAWFPHSSKQRVLVFARKPDAALINPRYVYKNTLVYEQNIVDDFSKFRVASGGLQLQSATVSASSAEISGVVSAVGVDSNMFTISTASVSSIMAQRGNAKNVLMNVNVEEGAVFLAEPVGDNEFRVPAQVRQPANSIPIRPVGSDVYDGARTRTVCSSPDTAFDFAPVTAGNTNAVWTASASSAAVTYPTNFMGRGSFRARFFLSSAAAGSGIFQVMARTLVYGLVNYTTNDAVLGSASFQSSSTAQQTVAVDIPFDFDTPVENLFITLTATGTTFTVSFGQITIDWYDVDAQYELSPGTVITVAGMSASQALTVRSVLNLEVVPDNRLARNLKVRSRVGDTAEITVAKALLATDQRFRLMYPMSMYASFEKVAGSLLTPESVVQAADGGFKSFLKGVLNVVGPAVGAIFPPAAPFIGPAMALGNSLLAADAVDRRTFAVDRRTFATDRTRFSSHSRASDAETARPQEPLCGRTEHVHTTECYLPRESPSRLYMRDPGHYRGRFRTFSRASDDDDADIDDKILEKARRLLLKRGDLVEKARQADAARVPSLKGIVFLPQQAAFTKRVPALDELVYGASAAGGRREEIFDLLNQENNKYRFTSTSQFVTVGEGEVTKTVELCVSFAPVLPVDKKGTPTMHPDEMYHLFGDLSTGGGPVKMYTDQRLADLSADLIRPTHGMVQLAARLTGSLYITVRSTVDQVDSIPMTEQIDGHSWHGAALNALQLGPRAVMISGSFDVVPGDLRLKMLHAVLNDKVLLMVGLNNEAIDAITANQELLDMYAGSTPDDPRTGEVRDWTEAYDPLGDVLVGCYLADTADPSMLVCAARILATMKTHKLRVNAGEPSVQGKMASEEFRQGSEGYRAAQKKMEDFFAVEVLGRTRKAWFIDHERAAHPEDPNYLPKLDRQIKKFLAGESDEQANNLANQILNFATKQVEKRDAPKNRAPANKQADKVREARLKLMQMMKK